MRWFWGLSAAALGALAVVLYLDQVLIPSQLKFRLKAGVEGALHRRAKSDDIHFSPFQGIVIKDFRIYDDDDKAPPLFFAESVSLDIEWLEFLRSGKVVVSMGMAVSPELNLRYDGKNGFNISDLLAGATAQAPGPRSAAPFVVSRVKISGGRCRFLYEGEVETRIEDFRGEARSDPKGGFEFDAEGNLGDAQGASGFTALGRFSENGAFQTSVKVDRLPVAAAKGYLKSLPVLISAEESGPVFVDIDSTAERLQVGVRTDLRGVSVEEEGARLKGDAALVSTVSYRYADDKTAWALGFQLRGARLESHDHLPSLESLSGGLKLDEKGLAAEKVAMTALGLPLTLSGRMDGYESPVFDVRVESGPVDLKDLPKPPSSLRLRGASRFSLSMRGRAQALLSSLRGRLEFRDAAIDAAFLGAPIRALKGTVEFTADAARWKGVSFSHAGRAYTTEGGVRGFKAPRVAVSVSTPKSTLSLAGSVQGREFQVDRLRGSGPSFKADLSGRVSVSRVSVRGGAQALLEDALPWLPPEAAGPLKKAKLRGGVRIQGSVDGKPDSPKDWRLSLHVRAENLQASGFQADSADFHVEQEHRKLRISSLTARGYSGAVAGESVIDLGPAAAHETSLRVEGLDLERLGTHPLLKDGGLNGLLSFQGRLRGPLEDCRRVSGEGQVNIKRARFLQFPLLGRVGDLLFSRKHNEIVFSQAAGRIKAAEGTFSTDDLILRSDQMVLRIIGKVVPGGALDLLVESRLNDRLLVPTLDVKRFAARLTGTLGLLVSVNISGTTAKPEYTVVPSPLGWLKKLKDSFFGD
ncbi:MAG TPA: hypothetical protein DCM05_06445 [Elusimicrobia bacterium]|nr:hypothetical protein [Elusimicrobiota bacterium]